MQPLTKEVMIFDLVLDGVLARKSKAHENNTSLQIQKYTLQNTSKLGGLRSRLER